MTLDEYIKEQRERVANMTLAQARQIVANHYGHDDMRIECEKAVWMLLNCADEKINGGWIPVTERLPEEDGEYLATIYDMDENHEYMDIAELEDGKWCYKPYILVKAWMPLPKPYKGGQEE